MAKYLVLYEVDESQLSSDPQEKKALMLALIGIVKKDMEKGLIKDWGIFGGQAAGYRVIEGTEEDLAAMMVSGIPYVSYTVYPLVSLEQLEKVVNNM